MRTKAIADLGQKEDNELFEQISFGLSIIIENAYSIEKSAEKLINDRNNIRGAHILRAVALEELAKCLILLDVIRCPRNNDIQFTVQLKKFNDHLSKGLYINYCEIRPATFSEVKEWVEIHRREYYLDGPNDVDWIFKNWILQQREENIYVDFIESNGDHFWITPKRYDEYALKRFNLEITPDIIKLVYAMADCGFFKKESIKIIANYWRSIEINDDLHWQLIREYNDYTLQLLNEKDLLNDQPKYKYVLIKDRWFFPLYQLDMKIEKVNKNELRKIQEQYYPY